MENASRRTTFLLIPVLLVAAACGRDDASRGGVFQPEVPPTPEGSFSVLANGAEGVATFAGPVSLVRETGRPEIIPIPLGDFSRFQTPFTLHVEKTGDSAENPLSGFILLDGEPFVSPSDFATGSSTLDVEVPLEPGSTLEIQLLGPVGAEVTVTVDGAIQPPPTVEITSPTRAAMLKQGTNAVSPVQITGQACHPAYPITSLEIDGQDVAVSGTNLCEPFSVTQQSEWGASIITGYAENSRGRVGMVVQSYLRSPQYGVPALTADPTARIPGGFLAQLNQPALDDDANDLDDVAELIERAFEAWRVDQALPNLLSPDQCFLYEFGVCLFSGSVWKNGQVTFAGPFVNLVPTAGALAATVEITNLVIPLRVPTNIGTFSGWVKADRVEYSAEMSFGPGGAGVNSITTTLSNLRVDFSSLPDWLDDFLTGIASTGNLLSNHIKNAIRDVSGDALEDVADETLELELETSASILGTEFSLTAGVDVPSVHSGFLRLGLSAQVFPTSPVASPPPSAFGPIVLGAAKPTIDPAGPALTVQARDDVINQTLWAAWQARVFHVSDAEVFAGIDVVGVSRVSVTPHLPPVVMHGGGGALADVRWGDIEISAMVDPTVFGLPGAGATPISVTVYVSGTTTLTIGFDEANQAATVGSTGSSIEVQVDAANDLLDEVAIGTSLEQLLGDVSERLVAAGIAAIPVPELNYDVPGVTPPGMVMRLEETTTNRPLGWTTIGGAIVPVFP